MKTPLLASILVTLGSTLFAADATPPPAPKPGASPSAEISGKATVTIDVNGKTVTRKLDLGTGQLEFNNGKDATCADAPEKAKKSVVIRTWLGVATGRPSDEVRAQLPIPDGTGLVLNEVMADSPAAKAGLQLNDVLTRLDEQILTNPDQLRALIGMKKDGDPVRIVYLRKGQEASVEIKLASHPEEEALALSPATLLLRNTIENAPGLKVTGVAPLIIERNAAFDKDGNFFFKFQGNPGEGKPGVPDDGQYHLYFKGAHADVTEAMKQLEKSLHEAGLSDEAIAKTRQAVAEALGKMQKAVSDAGGSKDEIARNAQKAVEELRRALENAWRPEEGAASKLWR
jgi:hypothetical protein